MTDQSRISWLDEQSQAPAIERQARNLDRFVDTFADGRVDEAELLAQEERLIELMKEIEPQLDAYQFVLAVASAAE